MFNIETNLESKALQENKTALMNLKTNNKVARKNKSNYTNELLPECELFDIKTNVKSNRYVKSKR